MVLFNDLKVAINHFFSFLFYNYYIPIEFKSLNRNMPEYSPKEISTLNLTSYSFDLLLNALLAKMERQHPGILRNKVGQIYGFAGYDKKLPSLKTELESLTGISINGKYLYDKKRELNSGKPIIKIANPYNYLTLDYLGHENVISFINEEITEKNEKKKQLLLLQTQNEYENHYYVSYHFGEYKQIVKAQATVKDNWKRIEYNYIYPEQDGSSKSFLYFGDIKKRADSLHIQTRTFMDGKMVPSGENILYIGYGDPSKSQYILGVFSAFDINNKLIAVKTIHERCASQEEMKKKSLAKKIPGYIAQELRNQRIENEIHIPNDKLEISPLSPYYLTYEKIAGEYTFNFKSENPEFSKLVIIIDPNNYKITSAMTGVLINHDEIKLIQNASVLNLRLSLSGQSSFLQLNIYVKTYYLNDQSKLAKGKYSGIDFENRLIAGDVDISFVSASEA